MEFSSTLPLEFSASYYIDELADAYTPKSPKYISLFRLSEISLPNQDKINDSYWSVIYNLISRGCPTRASRWLTHQLLKAYSIRYHIDLVSSGYQYKITGITENATNQINNSLSVIAGFQKAISWLLATGNIDTITTITFNIPQEQFELARLAIDDLNEWFSAFLILGNENREPLRVHLELLQTELSQQYALINSGLCSFRLDWNPDPHTSKPLTRLLTGSAINYPAIGEFDLDGRLLYNQVSSSEKQFAAEYILQSVFRKHSFRAGQLKIINRAIQGLDVVGLLPTGGGKSLTYQFTSLLQPTVTIVIDPINSLMRDQYEKLVENGIDTCLCINSDTTKTKEAQAQNLDRLAQGYIKFVFISPERLQIAKFRDGLSSCSSNGVHIGLAVVDEAHCVSEWGHDFRHTYLRLADNLKAHCKPAKGDRLTIMALTATASFDVLTDIRRELQMEREAEQTLPVDQIDRSELTYHVEKIVPIVSRNWKHMADWERQKELARTKYPVLKNILQQQLPEMLRLQSHHELYSPLEQSDIYPRAGLIFCNTKSDKRGDGVAALAKCGITIKNEYPPYSFEYIAGLDTENYLKIGTYIGGDNDHLAKNPVVIDLAKASFKNQGDYLANKLNLMVATKAFGMGIDKPNIRFTIHYGLPNSIESFYQEAGRAGRDRNPAICMILHHESDRFTNEEFLKNSFKGERKERDILHEFLTEVRYEAKFFLNQLTAKVKEIRSNVNSIRIKSERYLEIYGQYQENPEQRINFGKIDLWRDLRFYQDKIQNLTTPDDPESSTDKTISDSVLGFIKNYFEQQYPNSSSKDYLKHLNQQNAEGIETILKNNPDSDGPFTLVIGFTNNEVQHIRERLINDGYLQLPAHLKEWEAERFIRAAYNFTQEAKDFPEDIIYEYRRFYDSDHLGRYPGTLSPDGFEIKFKSDASIQNYLIDAFWRIRDIADTQRAIYRLSLLGVIDDYTINYSEKTVTLYFKRKPEVQYQDNFQTYLKRYQGDKSVSNWIAKVATRNEETQLRDCLYTLTDFVYSA